MTSLDRRAKECEAGLEQDGGPHDQRGRHDQRRQGVGKHHAEHDAEVTRADGARRFHELEVLQPQELGAGEACDLGPQTNTDGERWSTKAEQA